MRSFQSIRRLEVAVCKNRRQIHAFASHAAVQRQVQPVLEPSTASNLTGNSTSPPPDQSQRTNECSSKQNPNKHTFAVGNTQTTDPFALVAPELDQLRNSMITLMGSAHPGLTQVAEYYFKQPSKLLRPLLVLLFSLATNGLGHGWRHKSWLADCEASGSKPGLDAPLSRPDVLNDWNPNIPEHTMSFSSVFDLIRMSPSSVSQLHAPLFSSTEFEPRVANKLLPTQLRLAQIAEMIHVASLLHDDVIDTSPLRRGVPSGPASFGNKLTVLGGDFLLGRASAALSRLGESEVVELVASTITNLVEGEVMQVREVHMPETLMSGDIIEPGLITEQRPGRVSQERWNVYLKKTYLKTASLIAKTARGAVVLGGTQEGEMWKEVAYAYGRNLGIAFQLIDDMLDFSVSDASFGKPSGGADLRLGLATAPALYAWEEFEEMGPLIQRRFEGDGDVDLARQIVSSSKGVARTRELAETYAAKAREVLAHLPDSEAKAALHTMTELVVRRRH
ncbi:coq1 putative hexaprenyl diphosphate synthase [Serendipita sp. 401]|nr:coq1 putative hexaprenyl diphosphate synthase [Serendipita sp. 401]